MTTRPAALLSTLAITVTLAACGVAGPKGLPASTTAHPLSPPAGSASPTLEPSPRVGSTPTPPSSVDTPAERAAWEALMSPVGEYAASASYAAVLDRHGTVEPYASIRTQEERHIAALSRQLQRMGVDVPANPYLGILTAPENLASAARAWADGEVANIALYDRLLADADGDAQLTRVFTNLRRASAEQHLPAFEAAAANGGTTG